MAITDASRALEPSSAQPLGWDGRTLRQMLDEQDRLLAETGHYWGLRTLELQRGDPIRYEKIFSRLRGGLVSARETAMNISASPIVKEIGELSFMLYTPEGDSIALSRGIIPPTINLDQSELECDLDFVPHKARATRVKAALSNSFGFGGHNATLAMTAAT